MFVRVKATPNSPRKSIQIVESYRKNGRVKQRILRHIGIAMDEREEQQLKDLANETMAFMIAALTNKLPQQALFSLNADEIKQQLNTKRGRPVRKNIEDILPPSQVCLADIKEESRIIEGIDEIGGAMFDELYGTLFDSKKLTRLVKDVVLARLIHPASKHHTQHYLEKHFNKRYSLDAIYRMMDKIFPKIGEIKKRTFEKTQALFPEKVDLLFFDVTTLYFESTQTDELRNFGYSKDHRFNTTQVVLALATNQDGLPIGYELFEGNKAEVTTLVAAVQSWKKLFRIESVCFIGDRALFTIKNIALLEAHQYHYIIAAKLRTLPKTMHSRIFAAENYRTILLKKSLAWVGEFEYQNARLIINYKTSRALKDQKERQTLLTKIEKTLGKKAANPNKLITNAAIKKFVTKDKKAVVSIDESKIAQDVQWDGLHGIITNIRDEAAELLIARYARLWVIEESFRVNKHTLQMRPIYHWKPQRIHAHIALCYMTFSVLRHLQYRVNITQKISINEILDELLNVQASIHVHKKTNDRYRLPGYFTHNARKIYKAFGIERSLDAMVYFR